MKRLTASAVIAATAALMMPALRADVKTQEKTTMSLEGIMGSMMRMFGGAAAKDGITSTVAIKGERKSSMQDTTGQIVDLTEQKVYNLDPKKKEYKVVTFAELKAQYEKERADAEKRAKDMKPEEKEQVEQPGKELEVDVDVKETGARKSLAGYDVREVIQTVTTREKGKTLEQGGGFVLTNTLWLGPKIAALDELYAFQLRYMKAVYGEQYMADMQQMATMMAMYPSFQKMAGRMQAESGKLQGTPLSTMTVFESVRSEEQMKQLADQQQPSNSGGGGIGGMLARRMAGNRAAPTQRTKIMTTTHDMLSVSTSVSDADVAIPVGFKEKK